MNPRVILATAARVLNQLRRDPRTVALLVLVPALLVTLMKYVFDGNDLVFQRIGLPLVGIFPLISMFVVTAVAMLRERTSGTLERLMTMPLAKIDLLFGYGLAFALVAVVQAGVVCSVAIGVLGLDVQGPTWMVVALAVSNALLGMALGLFLSAFAATEFQAVQFLPAFLMPQLLLCGLFAPRDAMADVLRWVSNVLPMSFSYDALHRISTRSTIDSTTVLDLAITLAFATAALGLGAATLRRRTE
jgi:ABC-2 type transport system permease protein